MQQQVNYLASAAQASVEERSQFIWKVYAHVVGGILALVAIEAYIFSSGMAEGLITFMMQSPMLTFLLFIGSTMGAQYVARSAASTAVQYAAYAAYVFVFAAIMAPAILIAEMKQPGVVESAAGVTVLGAVGLIATAMITRKDFSFLRGIVVWGFMLALVAILASLFLGFQWGQWFSVAMIGLLGASILFQTSEIMRTYPTNRYVSAALELFGSIVLLFLWILRFMRE
jgi:FtsH-binding integral membrane protein